MDVGPEFDLALGLDSPSRLERTIAEFADDLDHGLARERDRIKHEYGFGAHQIGKRQPGWPALPFAGIGLPGPQVRTGVPKFRFLGWGSPQGFCAHLSGRPGTGHFA